MSLYDQFSRIATQYPDKPAVVGGDRSLTYAQLLRSSAQLSARLIEAGLRKNCTVCLCMESSVDLVTCIVAVLRAGGSYVTLPPDYPVERLRHVLGDSGATLLVGTESTQTRILHHRIEGVECFPLTGALRELIYEDKAGIDVGAAVHVNPCDSAYLFYTSGSTGRPKGVVISHGNITNLVDSEQRFIRYSPANVVLQFAALTFDVSAFEIWGALANGGTLVIPEQSMSTIDRLIYALRSQPVNTVFLTPSVFQFMLDEHPDLLLGLDQLCVGGEAMSVVDARKFCRIRADSNSETELINLYGPTEATTLVTAHRVKHVSVWQRRIPLGFPINNTMIYLLDEQHLPVGVGEEGEIYIGGAGVTNGYIGLPELTREKFIPNPFSQTPELMYQSGDLGKLNDDRIIEYMGRADSQVKIRGHRIELDEINATLLDYQWISAAHTLVLNGEGATKVLLAAITAPENKLDKPELFAWLKTRLPDYMVPNAVVFLETLPLTEAGKVDPQPIILAYQNAFSDPSDRQLSEQQRSMLDIWQSLLGQPSLGIDDEFDKIGGNSLLAAQSILEFEKAGIKVTLEDFLRFPTIRGLSSAVEFENHPEAELEV